MDSDALITLFQGNKIEKRHFPAFTASWHLFLDFYWVKHHPISLHCSCIDAYILTYTHISTPPSIIPTTVQSVPNHGDESKPGIMSGYADRSSDQSKTSINRLDYLRPGAMFRIKISKSPSKARHRSAFQIKTRSPAASSEWRLDEVVPVSICIQQ